ncbi:MAG: RsmB/NOP family class I SAM-dependent RNA methyltransferase [Eubacteriales bacterium]|nr:RsmB/NOP family class I SAM-dependent RNA methyltransferase [Eubacteriales bacterium]
MKLPEQFTDEMKALLGDEFKEYISSFSQESVQGIRINTRKISPEEFLRISPFALEKIPWCENGFYVQKAENVGKHPYYYAGLYYVQEPSAMLPAALLCALPGERVLDLCAAPGGKATELGSRIGDCGLLLANDISHSRAKGLLKNLELSGIGAMMVCSASPENLRLEYKEYFDKILVDAPCSGEGMFRRDPAMIKDYENRGPGYYAKIQREILAAAADMLRPGGKMVYSTCTFSKLENEENIDWLLQFCPDLRLLKKERLFPHRVKGEGHFAALIEKAPFGAEKNLDTESLSAKDLLSNTETFSHNFREKKSGKLTREKKAFFCRPPREWLQFQEEFLCVDFSSWQFAMAEERLYALPAAAEIKHQIRYLRTGLLLGECRNHRFEPSQALAMFLKKEDVRHAVSFSPTDERVLRYLKGETVALENHEARDKKGWILVCTDDFPLGWARCINGDLRNKYYAGWRMR